MPRVAKTYCAKTSISRLGDHLPIADPDVPRNRLPRRRCHQVRLRLKGYGVLGDTTRQRQSPKAKRQMRLRIGLGPFRARPATSAELVHQLKWQGRYEQALQIALSEIEREEEQESSLRGFDRQSVPWYYWEAAAIYRKLKRIATKSH